MQKKSCHKHTFNAMAVSVICGPHTKEFLDIGIRNKYIYINRSQTKNAFKNWTDCACSLWR